MKKILLIEDDPTLSQNIKETLSEEQIHVETVFDGLIAERILKKESFDCIIMDINLPGKNGYELCRQFRTYNTSTPVLMLTVFDELADKIEGYESGADDYLTKPFYMRELCLRVHALIKRSEARPVREFLKTDIIAGDIVIQTGSKKVMRQGKEIILTPREYQLLLTLIQNKGEVISKKDLLREIWNIQFESNTNIVEVYINFLRNKIDKPFGKQSIKTKMGYGYYFEE